MDTSDPTLLGPGFWDQGILTTLGINATSFAKTLHLPDVPLNECFMVFGGVGLLFNIVSRCEASQHVKKLDLRYLISYSNVLKSRKTKNLAVITPLFGLLPFIFQTTCNCIWLANAPSIMKNGHLVAFSLYWCLAFAYQVGILITAHTTGQSFPWFNVLHILSALGAADAWSATNGKTAFQTTERKALVAVYMALVLSLCAYAFFVYDVVGEICDYFDINCLTVSQLPVCSLQQF